MLKIEEKKKGWKKNSKNKSHTKTTLLRQRYKKKDKKCSHLNKSQRFQAPVSFKRDPHKRPGNREHRFGRVQPFVQP